MGKRNPGGARGGFIKLSNSFIPLMDINPEIKPIIKGIIILIISVLLIFLFKLSPINLIIKKNNYSHFGG